MDDQGLKNVVLALLPVDPKDLHVEQRFINTTTDEWHEVTIELTVDGAKHISTVRSRISPDTAASVAANELRVHLQD